MDRTTRIIGSTSSYQTVTPEAAPELCLETDPKARIAGKYASSGKARSQSLLVCRRRASVAANRAKRTIGNVIGHMDTNHLNVSSSNVIDLGTHKKGQRPLARVFLIETQKIQ